MSETWEEYLQRPDFQSLSSTDKIYAAKGFYREKRKEFPDITENEFIEGVKPSIYGKATLTESLGTGFLKSGASWAAPIVQGIHSVVGSEVPTLEDITKNVVGEDRLYRSSQGGLTNKIAEGVGSVVLDLPIYATVGKFIPQIGLGKTASTTQKVLSSLAHQIGVFGTTGAYRGLAEEDTIAGAKKGALEGAAVALPFTAASYPRNVFLRILGTGAAGGAISAAAGGDEQDIISNTILMGTLGAFSKTLQTKIDKGMVNEKNLETEVKKDTGKNLEDIVNEVTKTQSIKNEGKGLSVYKEPNMEGQPVEVDEVIKSKLDEPILSGLSPAEVSAMVFENEFQRVDRVKQSPVGLKLLNNDLKMQELNSMLDSMRKDIESKSQIPKEEGKGLTTYKEPEIQGQPTEVSEVSPVIEKPKQEVFIREQDEITQRDNHIVRELIKTTSDERQQSILKIAQEKQWSRERIKEASEKFKQRHNQEVELEQQENEKALVERTQAKEEFNRRSIAGEDINSKEMQSLFNKSINKLKVVGKPEDLYKGVYDTKKISELTEAEEVAALSGKEIKERKSVQLDTGIDPVKVAEAIRMGVDTVKNLASLAERVVREGVKTFKDFVYSMKNYLGDLFGKFSNQMSALYQKAIKSIPPLEGEKGKRGLFGVDINKSKVADSKAFKELKEKGDIVKIKDIGKIFKDIVFIYDKDIKLNDNYKIEKVVTKKGTNIYRTSEFKDKPLSEMLDAENWYKVYPFLKDVKVTSSDFSYFDMRNKKVYIEKNQSPSETLSDIKHEVSHVVIDAEGLPAGSSPEAELISLIFHATTVLENTLPRDMKGRAEFKYDINAIHTVADKMSHNKMRVSKDLYMTLEKVLGKYTDLKSLLKELYPNYQGERLEDFIYEKYRGVVAEGLAETTSKFNDIAKQLTPDEFKNLDINQLIELELGLYSSEKAGSITPLSQKAERLLDDESDISQRKVYDIANGVFNTFSNKGINVLEYLNNTIRKSLRLSSYHSELKKVTDLWHDNIERRGTEVSNKTRSMMNDFLEKITPEEEKLLNEKMWKLDRDRVVLTPEGLAKEGFTPNMIKAYQGIRRGFDYLHDRFLQIELAKLYTKTLTDTELIKTVEGYSSSSKDVQLQIRKAVANLKAEKIVVNSKIEGYLPHYRFGRYVVHITSEGETLFNKGFETMNEANDYLDKHKYLNEIPEKVLSENTKSRIIDTKYEKVDALEMMTIERYIPLIKRIMAEAGIKNADIDETTGILHDKWLDVFASGKLAKREGIPGYDMDLRKAIITYTDNFPRSILKRFIQPELKEIVKSISTQDGLREYAENMVDYLYNRTDREGKINKAVRSYMYINYLVLKPAFAVLNLTGRVTMTAPYTISEFARMRPESSFMEATKSGWKYFADAQNKEYQLVKDMASGFLKKTPLLDIIQNADYLNFEEKIVLSHLHRQGEFKAMRQVEIGGTEYEKWLGKIDFMGRLSERSNRIHAALTAVNLYKDLGYTGSMGERTSVRVKGLIDVVDKFIGKTQVLYSKANRPEIARGWKAPIMMFKNFMLNYLNLYYEMLGEKNKAAFVNGIGTTMAIGGAAGVIPAKDELNSIIDYFMKNVVDEPSWKLKKQDYINAMSKPTIAKTMLYGIPSLLGIDASGMVGFPNITGSAVLPIMQGAIELPKNIFRPDMTTTEKFKVFLPSQAKHLYNLYKITKYGVPTDRTGKPIIYPKDIEGVPYYSREAAFKMYENLPKEMSVSNKMAMAFGFPTIAVNKYYEDVQAIKDAKETSKVRVAQFHRAIAKAMIVDDKNRVDNLIDKAERMGLRLSSQAIVGHLSAYEK